MLEVVMQEGECTKRRSQYCSIKRVRSGLILVSDGMVFPSLGPATDESLSQVHVAFLKPAAVMGRERQFSKAVRGQTIEHSVE